MSSGKRLLQEYGVPALAGFSHASLREAGSSLYRTAPRGEPAKAGTPYNSRNGYFLVRPAHREVRRHAGRVEDDLLITHQGKMMDDATGRIHREVLPISKTHRPFALVNALINGSFLKLPIRRATPVLYRSLLRRNLEKALGN